MSPQPDYKKLEKKTIMTMYISIAFFTFGLVAIAILLGILISQSKGESTWLRWIPLLAALPVNLVIASVFSKKTTKKIVALRSARQASLEVNPETNSTGVSEDE